MNQFPQYPINPRFFEKSNYLKDFQCPQCQKTITEQDINQKNYQLWASDYANDMKWYRLPKTFMVIIPFMGLVSDWKP